MSIFQEEINASKALKKAKADKAAGRGVYAPGGLFDPNRFSQPSASSDSGISIPGFGEEENDEREETLNRLQTLGQGFAPDPFAYAQIVDEYVGKAFWAWGESQGYSDGIIEQMYSENVRQQVQVRIEQNLLKKADSDRQNRSGIFDAEIELNGEDPSTFKTFGMGRDYFLKTEEGFQELLGSALDFAGAALGADISAFAAGGSTRGGGGGGRKSLTPQEIRNQFDLDQLASMAQDMNRQLVLDEMDNPKALAREYVEAIVATKGEKTIDYNTYVRNKIENTSRFKSIYKNKPEHLKAEQHMAPYLQLATAHARPGDAADIAIGGSQFAASSSAFQGRLQREQTKTAPFISNLESRMEGLNSLFKG